MAVVVIKRFFRSKKTAKERLTYIAGRPGKEKERARHASSAVSITRRSRSPVTVEPVAPFNSWANRDRSFAIWYR